MNDLLDNLYFSSRVRRKLLGFGNRGQTLDDIRCSTLRLEAKIDHPFTHELDGGRILGIKKCHGRRRTKTSTSLPTIFQDFAHIDGHFTEINIHWTWRQALVTNRTVVSNVIHFIEMANRYATSSLLFV